MKKNTTMRVAIGFVIATILTTCIIGGAIAKYATSGNTSDSARVAKWGVTITPAGDSIFKDAYENVDGELHAESNDGALIVAPGTSGSTNIADRFVISGAPEVRVDVQAGYSIALSDNWKDASNAFYCPLVFTVDGRSISGLDYTSKAAFESAVNSAFAKVVSAHYAPNEDTSDALTGAPVITWEWPFEGAAGGKQTDEKDTFLGNLATAPTVTVGYHASVVQALQEPVTDLTGYKWVGNDSMSPRYLRDALGGNYTLMVNFSNQGVNYTGFRVEQGSNGANICYTNGSGKYTAFTGGNQTWQSDDWKTIVFTSDCTDANHKQDLINWLLDNGTLSKTKEPEVVTNLAGYTWIPNDTLNFPIVKDGISSDDQDVYFNVNFNCNTGGQNLNFDALEFGKGASPYSQSLIFQPQPGNPLGSAYYVYVGDGNEEGPWRDMWYSHSKVATPFAFIRFIDGDDIANETLISWLKANGALVKLPESLEGYTWTCTASAEECCRIITRFFDEKSGHDFYNVNTSLEFNNQNMQYSRIHVGVGSRSLNQIDISVDIPLVDNIPEHGVQLVYGKESSYKYVEGTGRFYDEEQDVEWTNRKITFGAGDTATYTQLIYLFYQMGTFSK